MLHLSADEKKAEVESICDLSGWPANGRLHMKRMGERGYDAFGIIRTEGTKVIPHVIHKESSKVEEFPSVEAMVDAGWIVDWKNR